MCIEKKRYPDGEWGKGRPGRIEWNDRGRPHRWTRSVFPHCFLDEGLWCSWPLIGRLESPRAKPFRAAHM